MAFVCEFWLYMFQIKDKIANGLIENIPTREKTIARDADRCSQAEIWSKMFLKNAEIFTNNNFWQLQSIRIPIQDGNLMIPHFK